MPQRVDGGLADLRPVRLYELPDTATRGLSEKMNGTKNNDNNIMFNRAGKAGLDTEYTRRGLLGLGIGAAAEKRDPERRTANDHASPMREAFFPITVTA